MGLLLSSLLKLQIYLTDFYKVICQSMIIKPSMLVVGRKVRSCIHKACGSVQPHNYVYIFEV